MDLKNYREIIEIKAGMSDFSLKVIILNIEKCTTRNNLTIYELLIADRSASVILTMYNSSIAELLNEGDIVALENCFVKHITVDQIRVKMKNEEFGLKRIGDFCMIYNSNINISKCQQPPPLSTSKNSKETANVLNKNYMTLQDKFPSKVIKNEKTLVDKHYIPTISNPFNIPSQFKLTSSTSATSLVQRTTHITNSSNLFEFTAKKEETSRTNRNATSSTARRTSLDIRKAYLKNKFR